MPSVPLPLLPTPAGLPFLHPGRGMVATELEALCNLQSPSSQVIESHKRDQGPTSSEPMVNSSAMR
jgi:hypothetical protein